MSKIFKILSIFIIQITPNNEKINMLSTISVEVDENIINLLMLAKNKDIFIKYNFDNELLLQCLVLI